MLALGELSRFACGRIEAVEVGSAFTQHNVNDGVSVLAPDGVRASASTRRMLVAAGTAGDVPIKSLGKIVGLCVGSGRYRPEVILGVRQHRLVGSALECDAPAVRAQHW